MVMVVLKMKMMAMTMFVHQCLPMIIPLCLLASQSYAAIQHDDNDKDGANSNDLKISDINYNVNPLE